MKKVVLILLIFVTVFITADNDPLTINTDEIRRIAHSQAKEDTSSLLWYSAGFVLSYWGIFAAMIIDPTPPVAELIGKSPDYIAVYTDYYMRETKRLQTRAAVWGCSTSGLASVASVVLFIWYCETYGYPNYYYY